MIQNDEKSLRILVVEDDLPTLELMQEVLSSFGLDVVTESDSEKASERISHEKFDGIFLDLMMPKLTGFQLAREVRLSQRNRSTTIIIVTANDDKKTMEEAFSAGGGFFLSKPIDLVPNVIHPDVLWACTTCRACEEQCPVMISYVDKITDMRRNLVLIKGEFPAELQKPFQGMEVNGNPWNLARVDRAGWADGLGIPLMSEHPKAPVLFWVGCAASYDDRAKKIARSTAKLMKAAGVEFAILGQEETCTGDPARRAGNEYLYRQLADKNVSTLNTVQPKLIVASCPHCMNSLGHEYKQIGGDYKVMHHTEYLETLVANKKLTPTPSEATITYHDPCYLGRHNQVYDEPRNVLDAIPGLKRVEMDRSRDRSFCCGGGGLMLFYEPKEEQRMGVKRVQMAAEAGANVMVTACPFCMVNIEDAIKVAGLEGKMTAIDLAELADQQIAREAPEAA